MSKSKPRKPPALRNDFNALRAVRYNHDHICQLVVSGVNPNSIEQATGDNLLFVDIPVASARVLIKYGARVNRRNSQELTPLHNCVRAEIAQVLLKHGGDVQAATADGYTPLMSAVISDNSDLVAVLLDHGAYDAAKLANNLTLFKDDGIYILLAGEDALTIAQHAGATASAGIIETFRAEKVRHSLAAVAADSRLSIAHAPAEGSEERRKF